MTEAARRIQFFLLRKYLISKSFQMLLCLLIHAVANTLSTMSTLSHEKKTRAVQNVPRLSQLVILIVHPRQTQHITTSAAATAVPTTSAAATAVPTTSAAATATAHDFGCRDCGCPRLRLPRLRCPRLRLRLRFKVHAVRSKMKQSPCILVHARHIEHPTIFAIIGQLAEWQ